MGVQIGHLKATGAIVGRVQTSRNVPPLGWLRSVMDLRNSICYDSVKAPTFICCVLQHSFGVAPKDGIFSIDSQFPLDQAV